MSALQSVLTELAVQVLPARQRGELIARLSRQYGLDAAVTAALQNGDSAQLASLTNTTLSACTLIVAPDAPAGGTGCHFIVATEVPHH